MLRTLFGIAIIESEEQAANAHFLISVTVKGIITFLRFLQSKNAPLSMMVMFFGIVKQSADLPIAY